MASERNSPTREEMDFKTMIDEFDQDVEENTNRALAIVKQMKDDTNKHAKDLELVE